MRRQDAEAERALKETNDGMNAVSGIAAADFNGDGLADVWSRGLCPAMSGSQAAFFAGAAAGADLPRSMTSSSSLAAG